MCWCGQVNTQGVNLLLGWLGDGDSLEADSLKWCRAGVLINPLPIISYLKSIIQILHMHQAGHTGAGPAPQGSPGVSWLNGVYQSCCSKCNVCWIQQGVCYTLRWLCASCCSCIGVGDAAIMWVNSGSGLVACHQVVARPLCTRGRWRLLGLLECQGWVGCPKLGWNSSRVVALYWLGSHVII